MSTPTVYHQHMTQRVPSDPHWTVNCSAYAAAMCFTDTTLGGIAITGREVRALSDEPVPDPASPGLNLQQIVNVARKLRVKLYDKTGETWTDLTHYVGSGASRAVVQIDYKTMGTHRCQANGDFGHALVLVLFKAGGTIVRASDPLCNATQDYPATAILAAAAKFAVDTGINHGLRFAITRNVPKWCA